MKNELNRIFVARYKKPCYWLIALKVIAAIALCCVLIEWRPLIGIFLSIIVLILATK